MFLLLFLMSVSYDLSQSQMMYNRMVPNDPRYFLQRPPVRRSAMEALERLRVPVARYYPQVETAIAPGPYQVPAVPYSGYPQSMDELYGRVPQWTEDFRQQLPETPDETEYVNYDYENAVEPAYRPAVYADDVYAQEALQEPESADSNLYNDFMMKYFYNDPAENSLPQQEEFDMQRRSNIQSMPSTSEKNQGVITLSNVQEANRNSNSSKNSVEVPAVVTSPAPIPSKTPPQVHMTAVPSSPEKKEIKSLVIPEPVALPREDRDNIWRELGQKEEPLFRPMQSSQRTTWEALSRAKNSAQKRPIPLLKKMKQNGQQNQAYDPLAEELENLKNEAHV